MRLLVVEDEPDLAGLLGQALGRGGFACDIAGSVAEATAFLRLATYHAIVLDLGLPDGSGMAVLSGLRRARSTLPVLIRTARDAPEDRVRGLDSGADDYLIKPFHLDELISRIRALLRRPNALLDVELRLANLVLRTTTREVEVADVQVELSRRETSLLEMLLRRQGHVVPRETIEDGLNGFDNPITPNAVEVLVHRLRRRLQECGATAAVHTIRGVGYILVAT